MLRLEIEFYRGTVYCALKRCHGNLRIGDSKHAWAQESSRNTGHWSLGLFVVNLLWSSGVLEGHGLPLGAMRMLWVFWEHMQVLGAGFVLLPTIMDWIGILSTGDPPNIQTPKLQRIPIAPEGPSIPKIGLTINPIALHGFLLYCFVFFMRCYTVLVHTILYSILSSYISYTRLCFTMLYYVYIKRYCSICFYDIS